MSAPDLSGLWEASAEALGPDGAVLYTFECDVTLAPKGEAFAVVLETKGGKSSRSVSYAEKLTALPSGEWHLRYGYEADPEHAATASHTFFGLSQMTFSADGKTATGTSCNYNGRYIITRLEARRRP